MDLRDLLALDTSLDDLQSGVDAGSREADHIQKTTASIDRLRLKALESPDLVGALERHVEALKASVCDQRAALRELRNAVARLRTEVSAMTVEVRLPSAIAADRQPR